METTNTNGATALQLRSILLQLARRQEELAIRKAGATSSWAARPWTVLGHRAAAAALRAEAKHLLAS